MGTDECAGYPVVWSIRAGGLHSKAAASERTEIVLYRD